VEAVNAWQEELEDCAESLVTKVRTRPRSVPTSSRSRRLAAPSSNDEPASLR